MAYKIGDMVRVVKQASTDSKFTDLSIGVVAPIVNIWVGLPYPYELDGFNDGVKEEEIELVAGGSE